MSKLWYFIRTASVKQGYKIWRGWKGRRANRIFQTRRMYIWTSCLSMIKHRNLGTRQGKWCSNKVWDRLVSCILHYPCKKRGRRSGPKVADEGTQATMCEVQLKVDLNGLHFPQKMQGALKGSMLKRWLVLIFKGRKRGKRLACLPSSAQLTVTKPVDWVA